MTRTLNPLLVNSGAVKKNYARVLKSKTFQEFGFWIEAPDVHFYPNASGVKFEMDFHQLGHGSIGGEVNSNTPFVAFNRKCRLTILRWVTR